jgi:hypothetical protein
MSTDRDVTSIVRSWLDEGVTVLPDRVLDAVLDQVPTTPQRRAWWPARRFLTLNYTMKIALAAAAVVVLAIIGIGVLLPKNNGVGPSVATPTPTPSATPAAAEVPLAGPLAIGRHPMTLGGVRLSIDLQTDGWISNGEFAIDKGHQDTAESAGFIFWTHSSPDNVYADPCAQQETTPFPGDDPANTAAELADLVTTVPGIEVVSGPSDVTVGGRPAKHVVVRIPDNIGCDPNDFYLWYDADNPGDARYATELGSTIYVWIIEADETLGTLVWIDGETYEESGPKAEREIRQIVKSIQFE